MKTLPAEIVPAETGGDAPTLLAFADAEGAVQHWLQIAGAGVIARGAAADAFPPAPVRTVLAVPGERVAVHWLQLAEGLAPAQAAAAARLMLVDASAEPLSDLHVAVGRPERNLTPVALVPNADMARWLAATTAAGLDPDSIVPTPVLLLLPDDGYVCRDRGGISDYRGPAAAFALEPELAGALVEDQPVEAIDDARFEAALPEILARLPLDLRQGAFARRKQWKFESGRLRRLGVLVLALTVLTLVVQVTTILGYTFAADRLRAEADALVAPGQGAGARGPGFGAAAAVFFEAVRATPNVEVARLEYRADGSLGATVMTDAPATLDSLRSRIESSGLEVIMGESRNAGGRPAADLTVRA